MSTILIAGHDGEEVSSVIAELLRNQDVEIRLISQTPSKQTNDRVKWMYCDPFSLDDLLAVMKGVDDVFYLEGLVARPLDLVQGSEADIELLLATNIIKAAKISGVKNLELKQSSIDPSLEIQALFKNDRITLQKSNRLKLTKLEPQIVRSVQRFVLPPNKTAIWTGEEYFRWLPKFCSNIVKVKYDGKECVFSLFHESFVILKLRRSTTPCESRISFNVVGGLLNAKRSRGRLEFTESLDRNFVFGALHNFVPALPWFVYKFTQAIVHVFVMGAFGEHLKWCYLTEDKK